MKNLTIALAFLMTLSLPVSAQDFQKGYAAYNAGDYATALKEWKPLAEAGDADAQYNLGVIYDKG
jgi:TPR repeat protein